MIDNEGREDRYVLLFTEDSALFAPRFLPLPLRAHARVDWDRMSDVVVRR